MRPTRLIEPGGAPGEDFDTPAYTRALTSLPEFQRDQAMQAADRADAGNRTFNQQFSATMASEAGGVVARWIAGLLGRKQPGGEKGEGAKPRV